MGLWFCNDEYSPERAARQAASVRYFMAKVCSKWKAEELARKRGFKESHRAFYRAPKASKR